MKVFKHSVILREVLVDISEDDDATVGVNLAGHPAVGLLVPILNDTPTITVEASIDGTTWVPLKDSDGSANAIEITGGAAAFLVSADDLTPMAPYVGDIAGEDGMLVRLKLSAAQTADRVFAWIALA